MSILRLFSRLRLTLIGVGLFILLGLSSCIVNPFKPAHPNPALPTYTQSSLFAAESNASTSGARILETARTMAVINKDIIKGSCWDYIHEVFNRAGYPMRKRKTVFKGHIHKGPYAYEQIQAGDWVYFKNYNYKNNPHSSIFVRWEDKANKQALMLSYAGERRKQPARYKVYDLRSAYQIIRAQ